MKVKLDGESVKQFFVNHGDKLGLTVVAVLAIAAVVHGVTLEKSPPELSSDAIESQARQAEDRLTTSSWRDDDVFPSEWTVVNENGFVELRPEVIAWPTWVRPYVPLKGKRPEPDFLTVEDLRVSTGRGLFAVGGGEKKEDPFGGRRFPPGGGGEKKVPGVVPPAGAKAVGKHFAVVTGLVPFAHQKREYIRRFRDATHPDAEYDPGKEQPKYYRYVIERAEVVPDQEELNWRAINHPLDLSRPVAELREPGIEALYKEWSATAEEVVDELFIEECLVYGNVFENRAGWLPPLLLRDWKMTEVSHPRVAAEQEKLLGELEQDSRGVPQFGFDFDEEDPLAEKVEEFGYKLFRHFDFDVEPGKRYVYRVQLVLHNPNHRMEDRYLEDPESKNGMFRVTPFSDPTPAVAVPPPVELLAGEVKVDRRTGAVSGKVMITVLEDVRKAIENAAKQVGQIRIPRKQEAAEAEIRAMANQWRDVEVIEATGTFEVAVGSYLNPVGDTTAVHPLTRRSAELNGVRFHSDHLLVDMLGGSILREEDNSARGEVYFTEPGRMLLLDNMGRLIVRSELADRAEFQRRAPSSAAGTPDATGKPRPSKPADDLRDPLDDLFNPRR